MGGEENTQAAADRPYGQVAKYFGKCILCNTCASTSDGLNKATAEQQNEEQRPKASIVCEVRRDKDARSVNLPRETGADTVSQVIESSSS